MGIWTKRIRDAYASPPAPAFAVDETSIDPAVFGLASYTSPTAPAPRIDRRAAIQVPAVKRARDLIAGALGQLPWELYTPTRDRVRDYPLFTQPEANTPGTVTKTRIAEDLLFEAIAWFRITEWADLGPAGRWPTRVKRLDPRTVDVRPNGTVWIDGREVPSDTLIRFDSPNDPLLVAGARAIRTCLALETAAGLYAAEPMPLGYFAPADGVDPATDDEIVKILTDWQAARQKRATGYVPASLQYKSVQFSPEQMQLADARQHAVLEIARIAGVDPEELGVSTTSRTYANQWDRRKAFVDFTLGGYVSAIQDRLSMPDITPDGFYARLALDAFMRSDALSRYTAYAAGLAVGALDEADIARLEDNPTPRPTRSTPTMTPIAASDSELITFAADTLTFAADTLTLDGTATFSVDPEARTISGLAAPFGVPAVSQGRKYQFSPGTLTFAAPQRVKLLVGHDPGHAIGFATELTERPASAHGPAGIYGVFRVASGPRGDEALQLAADGVLDGLSIGLASGGTFADRAGIIHAVNARIAEISLVPIPSFDDARVNTVTLSDDATQGPDFATLVKDAVAAGLASATFSTTSRATVGAGDPTFIAEELPYRFDGGRSEHSFSGDLRASASGDLDARQRLETFMADPAVFAVTTGNVTALNPAVSRPELFVPNLSYSTPLWDLVSNGTVDDATPFTIPKFSSATGLVGAHTQGVEPTPGTFVATNQTITPTPLSGKIEINREVWDQGGSPQADQIIWAEMLNGWFEAREARIAALLNGIAVANTQGGAELNFAGAVDAALVDAVTNYLAGLQFVRGGNRFTALALDGNLFPALVNAKDTTGRKLLPVLGPTNAQGQVSGAFDRVALGGTEGRAAWALGTGNAANSYNFVPTSVWAWSSAPRKFTFEYQIKSIDLAIWGYMATACTRDSDVKRLDYTTADV